MNSNGLKGIFKYAAAAMVAAPLLFSAAAMAQQADTPASPPAADITAEAVPASVSSSPGGGDVNYLYPLALLGLLTIPGLWWLRKVTPPQPKTADFPAIRIFDKVENNEETAAKTPIWQLLLLTTMASALIVGMSEPLVNPDQPLGGQGPLLIVVDNGWASGANWDRRTDEMMRLIERADRAGRAVSILMTAGSGDGAPAHITGPLSAADARRLVQGMAPQPWASNRTAAIHALEAFEGPAVPVWLSNGLSDESAAALAERLQQLGSLRVLADAHQDSPQMLVPPDASDAALEFTVRRPHRGAEDTVSLIARADDGRMLARVEGRFEQGQNEVQITFDLPSEIRNQLMLVSIEGENSAGAVVMLDERWRRRPVGLVGERTPDSGNPLLTETHYLQQAIGPFVDLRSGNVQEILAQELSVLLMTDGSTFGSADRARINEWVEQGGTVLRFAGPRLAQQVEDNLLPVVLRRGERDIGGAMDWSEPARVAPFAPGTPFYGIDLPDNVRINRQVLAQPGLDIRERTWASLEDGTPLVTAERRGQGWIILVHTSADPSWSNLALSGLYIDMLRAVVANSQGVSGISRDVALPPIQTLDGYGRLGVPSVSAQALGAEAARQGIVNSAHPPGFYGDEYARRAHNIGASGSSFEPLPDMPDSVVREFYERNTEFDLKGPLLYGALGLLIVDLVVILAQRGLLPGSGSGGNGPQSPSYTGQQGIRRREPRPGM